MVNSIDLRDLPVRLAEALALVTSGHKVVLTEGAIPRARLVPYAEAPQRVAGLHPGAIDAAPDFDAPLPDDFWAGQQ